MGCPEFLGIVVAMRGNAACRRNRFRCWWYRIVNGKHFDAVLPKADKATMSCLLMQLLSPESLLCTDGAAVYREFAKDEGIAP